MYLSLNHFAGIWGLKEVELALINMSDTSMPLNGLVDTHIGSDPFVFLLCIVSSSMLPTYLPQMAEVPSGALD